MRPRWLTPLREPVLAVVTVIAVVGGPSPAAPLSAQAPLPGNIFESERRLDQIRREREHLRFEMSQIRSRVTGLASELENLERQLGSASDLIEEFDRLIDLREQQIEQNTYELLMARDRLVERNAILQRRLRDIYKRGPLATVEVLLTADSFSDLLNRYRYLSLVARSDRRLADEVAELEPLRVSRERGQRNNREQLARAREERTLEQVRLADLRQQQLSTLTDVRAQANVTGQRLTQLERVEVSLATLIADFENRRSGSAASLTARAAFADAGSPPSAEPSEPARIATLEWPLEGRLLYPFGPVTASDGTVLRWNGIGIGAPEGSPVTAVEAGTVALAGPFDGYGPTVVLNHDDGYYTLYLYLREVAVREGQRVGRATLLGTVGGQPAGEGPHIEFQIRVPGGHAVDPLTWLEQR